MVIRLFLENSSFFKLARVINVVEDEDKILNDDEFQHNFSVQTNGAQLDNVTPNALPVLRNPIRQRQPPSYLQDYIT